MCIAVPGKVIEIYEDETALVEFIGVRKNINISFVEDVNIGDYLLVHVGFAIEKMDYLEGEETVKIFKSMVSE